MARLHAPGRAWRALAAAASMAILPTALAAQGAPTQVISRAELEAAGWTRLSELVFAVRGAGRASVDGITVLGNVSALPTWETTPGRDEWLVLVDGQPVDVTIAGVTVLDLLPVALTQLDSVTVHHGAAFVAGRMAPHGVIQLYTQRGLAGLTASASHYSGNEVGDPGPLTFTPERTPNVDNSGPFHRARVAYGAPNWDVDAAVRRWTDNLTDVRLVERYERAAAPARPDLWVRNVAPVIRAGAATPFGRHDVHAGLAQLRGTFFVPSVRDDQSLNTKLRFAGISGSGSIAAASTWSYRLSASELDAAPYDAPLPATLAHDRHEVAGALTLGHRLGSVAVTGGGSLARHALTSAPALATSSRLLNTTTGGVFLGLSGSSGRWRQGISGTLGRGIAAMRGSGLLSVERAIDSTSHVRLSVAADARASGDDGAWIDLELFGLGDVVEDRRHTVTTELAVARPLAAGVTLGLAAVGRRETGVRLVDLDTATSIPHRAPGVSAPLSFSVGELRASLDLPVTGAVQGGATWRFAGTLTGGDAIRDARASLPRHVFDASVVLTPVYDIRVRPAVHLATSSRWRAAGTSDLETVPAVTRLDLSLEKWLLRRRLRAQVLARNLLNDVERHHPLGADFRLRVFAGATLTF
ncbi:MAG TPA: Plug domain-containing protein [Gemmatimonadaceae bacterium]|nr:Plug domain-containing protein [Gemmatimonadaceae bacterium]